MESTLQLIKNTTYRLSTRAKFTIPPTGHKGDSRFSPHTYLSVQTKKQQERNRQAGKPEAMSHRDISSISDVSRV